MPVADITPAQQGTDAVRSDHDDDASEGDALVGGGRGPATPIVASDQCSTFIARGVMLIFPLIACGLLLCAGGFCSADSPLSILQPARNQSSSVMNDAPRWDNATVSSNFSTATTIPLLASVSKSAAPTRMFAPSSSASPSRNVVAQASVSLSAAASATPSASRPASFSVTPSRPPSVSVTASSPPTRSATATPSTTGTFAALPLAQLPTVTLAALHWQDHGDKSFTNSLRKWNASGLLSLVSERLAFINARVLPSQTSRVENLAKSMGFTVLGNHSNMGIGVGMSELTRAATSDYVLFLEKDWILMPRYNDSASRILDAAWRNLLTFVMERDIQKVNLRDGRDLHRVFSQGNISRPCAADPPLDVYCEDHRDVGGAPIWERKPWYTHCFTGDPELVCFPGNRHGQWTNNPILYRRDWFMRHFYPAASHITGWNDMEATILRYVDVKTFNGTVAIAPIGVFSHHEIDGRRRRSMRERRLRAGTG